jgi:LysM repeat protein
VWCSFGSVRVKGEVAAEISAGDKPGAGRMGVVRCRAPAQVARVQSGESVGRLAAAHGLALETLAKLNPEVADLSKVFVGQALRLAAARVPLSLALPGGASFRAPQDFDLDTAGAGQPWSYSYVRLSLSALAPLAAPAAGGTLVTLHGEGFTSALCKTFCRHRPAHMAAVPPAVVAQPQTA